jgi:hypothetical protein
VDWWVGASNPTHGPCQWDKLAHPFPFTNWELYHHFYKTSIFFCLVVSLIYGLFHAYNNILIVDVFATHFAWVYIWTTRLMLVLVPIVGKYCPRNGSQVLDSNKSACCWRGPSWRNYLLPYLQKLPPLVHNESKSTNLNLYEVVKVNQIYHALISFHLQWNFNYTFICSQNNLLMLLFVLLKW